MSNLTYESISKNNALDHMVNRGYHHISFDNKLSLAHFKDTDAFGIFDEKELCGLILIVNGLTFFEPHIMLDESKRGRLGLSICKKFLKDKIKSYKLMIGRVPKDKKSALVFAKLVGFLDFHKTDNHILVGYQEKSEAINE